LITITGASDDLIEIDGDLSEEFGYSDHRNSSDNQGDLLGFSDGTLLRIRHDSEGVWRITRLKAGAATFALEQADHDGRTDTATLDGDVRWVVHGSSFIGRR
jgi:hypothetical protein